MSFRQYLVSYRYKTAPKSSLTATLFSYTANEYLYVTILICCLLVQFERIKPVCRTCHMTLNIVEPYQIMQNLGLITRTVSDCRLLH